MVTMVLIVCLSFSGYLVTNVPVYFKWIGKLSYFSYAYAALVRHTAICCLSAEAASIVSRGVLACCRTDSPGSGRVVSTVGQVSSCACVAYRASGSDIRHGDPWPRPVFPPMTCAHAVTQVRNELQGLTFRAADGSLVPGASLVPVGLQNTLSVEGNVLILLAFTVITRVAAFAMTEAAAKLRYL